MDRSKQLAEEKIGKLLLTFSVPAIVGMLVNALYNIVDRIFVGRGVGSLAIAAITIGFPIMIILMAFTMLVGLGATSLISIKLGQDRKDEAEKIMGNSMTLLVIIMLIMTVSGLIFLEPLLRIFGASADVMPYAKAYLRIILYGAVFQGIGFGINNIIRAEGNPKIAMLSMLIGAISNTILDPIFIYGFKMGIEGAAWATIISQAASAVWVVSHFISGRSNLKFRKENLRLQGKIIFDIFSIGFAPFMMQLAASLVTAILNSQLGKFGGDIAISAMGIINSVSTIILMPIFGINQGSQPIIGFNYGAKQYDRVKQTFRYAATAATILVVIGFFLIRIFPVQLISLFAQGDQTLIDIGTNGIRIFFFAMPIIGFQIVSANYFQAVGKPKQAAILSLSRQVLFLIPALLILPRFFKLNGIWMAAPVADALAFVVTSVWIIFEIKNLGKERDSVPSSTKPFISGLD
ncbi:MATE family efflux transporter [Alkaliphilus oremlandii]|uniref:Multidrug export protein MepA n=1 Tax=Alkaliphilus oremlandii (strain OhILAs) TaxID=350688 RepID=A8MI72_ALKOO|nr:MATE family efflux transporter [Alkaliphilus oremlandii]ABW19504.1 MATE efflux family protein [Alkaliphilus oremlandii OhILAs]